MPRTTSISWSVAGLLLIAATSAPQALATGDLWSVNIDDGPAPPPAQRPPFSQGARYDPSLLLYQIPGIAGGYVGFALILVFALLTFGRRARRDAQSSSRALSMEMVKPLKRALDPSPISPSDSAAGWRRWGTHQHKTTPSMQQNDDSPVSFDEKLIEKDKIQRQEEMERIYAVVMSEDTIAPRTVRLRDADVEIPSIKSPTHTRNLSSKSFSNRHPPQLRDLNNEASGSETSLPPATNTGPPAQAVYSLQAADSSNTISSLEDKSRPQAEAHLQQAARRTPSPALQHLPTSPRAGRGQAAVHSHSRQSSTGSTRSRSSRAGVRNLQISSPMPLPTMPSSADQYGDMVNRSPHYIPSNPPRPPSPPTRSLPQTPFEDDNYEQGKGGRDHDDRAPYHNDADATSKEHGTNAMIIHAYGGEDIDQPRPPPLEAPQRGVGGLRVAPPVSAPRFWAATGSSPSHQQGNSPNSAGATNNPLPFRAQNRTPVSAAKSPTYQAFSPGPMRTTFVSPRRDRFLPGGMNPIPASGLPNSAALLSAGLATPYSPYMPFSPMTPITPHLTNRQERRAREREAGRAVATEEDRVQAANDMWGDAW